MASESLAIYINHLNLMMIHGVLGRKYLTKVTKALLRCITVSK